MLNIIKKETTWEGKRLILETGRMANLAAGSVLVTYGNTQILATVSVGSKVNPEIDFIPLSVHYLEKYYAVGKIPGGFFKRESKPSEREVLISRLIDRPIRPIINPNFKNEIQIIVNVLSYDSEVDTDVPAIIAASSALAISGVPTLGIVGASRVCKLSNNLQVNPLVSEINEHNNSLNLLVAGTKEGILMVESEASELQEEEMLEALDAGFESFQQIITLIEDLQKNVNRPELQAIPFSEGYSKLLNRVNELTRSKLVECFAIKTKQERSSAIEKVLEETRESLKKDFLEEDIAVYFKTLFKDVEKDIVRNTILEKAVRIDGRKVNEIRNIQCEIDVLNAAHGSALFTRGETQALVVATLGSEEDEQIVDGILGDGRDKFMLHYNFPSFSVGEVGRVGAPGRREVGHGKLAFRALNPVMPKESEFPYTVRLVSEVLQSNGSSSMATVCGSSLALMAAGVPIKKTVAGIAMGLIKEGEGYAILSDILGDEDYLGDMDFKVAGTKDGITALQMDLKISSIDSVIMKKALEQAKEGRMHILNKMEETISSARREVGKSTPKIRVIAIDKEKIPEVIGSGGKVIKALTSAYGVKITVKDDGIVKIYGNNEENINNVLKEIASKVLEPEVGAIYSGKVVKLLDFGAFVNFIGNKDGFLHISEITDNRNTNISSILKVGDIIKIKVAKIDHQGKIRLTMKDIAQ